jgi:hypothetical protein
MLKPDVCCGSLCGLLIRLRPCLKRNRKPTLTTIAPTISRARTVVPRLCRRPLRARNRPNCFMGRLSSGSGQTIDVGQESLLGARLAYKAGCDRLEASDVSYVELKSLVLGVATAIEALTGLVLTAFPSWFTRLLFGASPHRGGYCYGPRRLHCLVFARSRVLALSPIERTRGAYRDARIQPVGNDVSCLGWPRL